MHQLIIARRAASPNSSLKMTANQFKERKWDGLIDFTCGCAGGTASVYVGQPLDTVKVKMQTFSHLYKNAVHCFASTYKQEGIYRGLYAGTIPALSAQVSENAILFMAYGFCQKSVMMVQNKTEVSQLNSFSNACAGSMAGIFCSFALTPTELIKCRLQAAAENARITEGAAMTIEKPTASMFIRQILKDEGPIGLFRGLVPTLLREVPGYFFFFGSYELSRSFFAAPGQSKNDIGPLATMVSGALGGVSMWAIIFPTDVIKSKVQVESGKSKGFMVILRQIVQTEGIQGLYRGLMPCLLRTAPATAALFLAFENTKKFLSHIAYGNYHSQLDS